jgi:hypothetical protein
MGNYELWYCNPKGERIEPILDAISFAYVLTDSGTGYFTMAIHRGEQTYARARPEYRVHVYRQPEDGALDLEMIYVLSQFDFDITETGYETLTMGGSDLNVLLKRRIAAYRAESATVTFSSTNADEVAKTAVDYNLGSNADSGSHDGRDLTDVGFAIEATATRGGNIDYSFAWINILTVMQGVQQRARANGTELWFGIEPLTDTSFEFRTWMGQRGSDRTLSGGSTIIVSLANGNLLDPSLALDFDAERNYVFAGGQGQDTALTQNRIIEESEDEDATGRALIARSETFYNASRYDSAKGVQEAADSELINRRAVAEFTGAILDTPQTPYGGLGWKLGDQVTVDFAGYQFDARIRAVSVSVSGQDEKVEGRLEPVDSGVFTT